MAPDNVGRALKNAKRRARTPNPFVAAWREYSGAKRRLAKAQRRLTKLSEQLDEARDDHRLAIEDAADALRMVALPLDSAAAGQ